MNRSINRSQHLISCSSVVSDISDDENSTSSKKEVRFSSRGTIRIYERSSSYDPTTTWYKVEDYLQFRADRATDVSRIRGRHPDDLKEVECFWGLENSLVPDLKQRVVKTRQIITQGVLKVQEDCKDCNTAESRLCPHKIAETAASSSTWSAAVARKKALFYSSQVSLLTPI